MQCRKGMLALALMAILVFYTRPGPVLEAGNAGGNANEINGRCPQGTRATWVPFYEDFNNVDNWHKTGDIEWYTGGSDPTYLGLQGNGRTSNTEEGSAITNTGVIPAFRAPCSLQFRYTTSNSFEGYQGDIARLYISDDNGNTWHELWNTQTEYDWAWQLSPEFDLSTYNTEAGQFLVNFYLHCNYNNDDFLVDWVKITAYQNNAPSPPTSITPDSTGDKTPRVEWNAGSDPDGDTLTYSIQVGTYSGGDDVQPWTDVGTDTYVQSTTPQAPGTYYFQVKAFDGELYSDVHEETVQITNDPPSEVSDIQPDSTGDATPQISWYPATDPDPDDTIDHYEIQIGTTSGGSDVISWTSTGTATIYDVPSPLEYKTYYVQVRAYDGYDYGPVHEETMLIDESLNSPPSAPAWIEPNATTVIRPQIQWGESTDPDGDPIVEYQIRLGTSSGGSEVFDWTSTGTNRYYDVSTDLAVGIYYVQVKASDGHHWGGVREESMEIENTPPESPTVLKVDDMDVPANTYNKRPTITWTGASDINPEQTLEYEIRISTTDPLSQPSSGGDVLNWTSTGTEKYYIPTDPMGPGNYYVDVRAFDGIDYSPSPKCGQMVISNHPPSEVSGIAPDSTNIKAPTISWTPASDQDNDPVAYYIQIGQSPGGNEVLNWTYVGDSTLYILSQVLSPGDYYVQIITTDGYDNSTVHEEILSIYNTPPSEVPAIYPDTTPSQTPNISWDPAIDPDGDFITYQLRIGTTTGGSDVLDWFDTGEARTYQVNTTLAYGTYYVSVRAFDGFEYSPVHEETLNISAGANTPPPPPTNILPDQANITTPLITWSAVVDEDGDTVTYRIQIGTTSGGNEVFEWRDTGNKTEYQVTPQDNLTAGTYFVQVKAFDGEEESPTHEETLVIIIESNQPPFPPEHIYPDTTVDRTPDIYWSKAQDPNGDPVTYQIQIGTTSGGSDILGWTDTGSETHYQVGDNSPLDYGTYYVQVKAFDGELWSDVLEEEMVIKSTNTPPEPPTTILPDETKSHTPEITWYGASDIDNDPLTYEIRIGTQPGGSDILEWTSTGVDNSYQVSADLADNTYYVAVRAFDGTDYSDEHEETMVISPDANSPPTPPTKLTPKSTSSTKPTIAWYGAVDADGDTLTYYLQVGTTSYGNDTLPWTHTQTNSYTFPVPLEYGMYYVQIVATDGKQNSSIFQDTMVVTERGNRAPYPPIDIQPDSTRNPMPNITWTGAWDEDGDTVYYWIQIGTSSGMADVLAPTYTGRNNWIQIAEPLEPGTYWVLVVSTDGIANCTEGYIDTITIGKNTPPEPPGALNPDTIYTDDPSIEWSPASDKDGDDVSYYISIEDQNGTLIVPWSHTSTSTYTPSSLPPGTYTVHIVANDGWTNGTMASYTITVLERIFGFCIHVHPTSITVSNGGTSFNIELTINNTGTVQDTYWINISGTYKSYITFKPVAGMNISGPSATLSLNMETNVTLTLTLNIPTDLEKLEAHGKLYITVTSVGNQSDRSVGIAIDVEHEDQNKIGDIIHSEYCLPVILLIVILVIALAALYAIRRRKAGPKMAEAGSLDEFKEEFDEVVSEGESGKVPTRKVALKGKGAGGKVSKGYGTERRQPRRVQPQKLERVPHGTEAGTEAGTEGREAEADLSMDIGDLDSEIEDMEKREIMDLMKRK